METDFLYEQITELKTPIGFFSVYNEGRRIPFSVIPNSMSIPSNIYDSNNQILDTIQTNTNYQIVIETKELAIGKEYAILFSRGNWAYCDSDEHTTCYCARINNWIVGIGAYDPNDSRKQDQMLEYSRGKGFLEHRFIQSPSVYDERSFTGYTVDTADDFRGYKFKLFDYSISNIYFSVAWLQITHHPASEYINALALWLC